MALARNQRRVLELLAGSARELAGIELAEALGGMARSSVYAALAALQRDGLVRARWDLPRAGASAGAGAASHPRRLVRISAEGRRALAWASAAEPSPRRRPAHGPLADGLAARGPAEGGAS